MKKMKFIIISLILLVFSTNVYAENKSHYCEYKIGEMQLVVYEKEDKNIGYTINPNNVTQIEFLGKKEEIRVNLEPDLDKNLFYNGEEFYCTNVNLKFESIFLSSKKKVTFTTNRDDNNSLTILDTKLGEYNSFCNYTYKNPSVENKRFNFKVSIGENELETEFGGFYSQTNTKGQKTGVDLELFLNKEGIFDCKNVEIKVKTCPTTGESPDYLYFGPSNSFDNVCIGNNNASIHDVIIKAEEDYNEEAPDDPTVIDPGLDCDGIFSGKFGEFLKKAYNLIKFAVPIVIIALAIVDFLKAMASQDQNELKKAANKLVKRLVIGVILFILPTLIEFILHLAGIEFGTCGIGRS